MEIEKVGTQVRVAMRQPGWPPYVPVAWAADQGSPLIDFLPGPGEMMCAGNRGMHCVP
jgi:hypothetical protein